MPVGAVISNKASISFTGKGATNYGAIQQENLMRLLEHFADGVPPQYPTVGQIWYDTANSILNLCNSASPLTWKSLGGVQVTNVGAAAPSPASVGDLWFQRTGSSSGILYAFTGIGRYPVLGGVVGGWSQIWPQITMVAGREEYNATLALVNQLIGPASMGGAGAIGKNINNVTDLVTLDTNLRAKFTARGPLDPNVLVPTNGDMSELLVDPDSNDWDTLLAAAKYAIGRLELPPNYADDISPVPFVSDGRQVAPSLLSLNPINPAYPSLERRSGRRFGIVTLSRLYTETLNVLTTAVANRYSLKGINGQLGTNPTFEPNIIGTKHAQYGGLLAGNFNQIFVTLRFNFTNQAALESFVNSGGNIQVTMSLGNPSTTGDTNMRALLDQRGVVRISADKTRVFANVLPLALSVPSNSAGFLTAAPGGSTMASYTISGASYVVTLARETPQSYVLSLSATSTGPMQGNLTYRYDVISDSETYLAPALTSVYAAPLPFTAAHFVAGTPLMVQQP